MKSSRSCLKSRQIHEIFRQCACLVARVILVLNGQLVVLNFLTCYLPSPACQVRCFPLLLRRLKRKSVLMMMDDYIKKQASTFWFFRSRKFAFLYQVLLMFQCHLQDLQYAILSTITYISPVTTSTVNYRLPNYYHWPILCRPSLCHAGLTGVAVSHLWRY